MTLKVQLGASPKALESLDFTYLLDLAHKALAADMPSKYQQPPDLQLVWEGIALKTLHCMSDHFPGNDLAWETGKPHFTCYVPSCR